MSELSNLEINYPISPDVLIDYIKNTASFPVFMGSGCIKFSTEPYMGKGSKLSEDSNSVEIAFEKELDRLSVKQILDKLKLSIRAFEDYLNSL